MVHNIQPEIEMGMRTIGHAVHQSPSVHTGWNQILESTAVIMNSIHSVSCYIFGLLQNYSFSLEAAADTYKNRESELASVNIGYILLHTYLQYISTLCRMPKYQILVQEAGGVGGRKQKGRSRSSELKAVIYNYDKQWTEVLHNNIGNLLLWTEPLKKKVCRYYSTPKGCRKGNQCRFIHLVSQVL